MANLKEIRTRITSVTSTRQITNAMKMVAASKLRKAQDSIIQLRPYANKFHEILEHISSISNSDFENVYATEDKDPKILVILISSNKGLCGPFNSNIVKKIIELKENQYSEQLRRGKLHFMSIGKKAADILETKKVHIVERYDNLFNDLSFENVNKHAEKFMQFFLQKEYDQIDIVYNQFKNAAVQILKHEQFLPIVSHESPESLIHDYIFEPSKEYIIENLIPDSLKLHLYQAVLDSNAAEQGARMTAMHQATDNASEMIKNLTLSYNKARQAAITNEILEITAGAEALSS